MAVTPEAQAQLAEQRKAIDAIEDPEKRAKMLRLFEEVNQLQIGLPLQDRQVNYNPGPFRPIQRGVPADLAHARRAGNGYGISPKWMSGPVGIVSAVQKQSRTSLKEMLFWLGAISLNLGVINLIPMPPFDGGGIAIALYEMITRPPNES